ncbi:hydroxyethylthiazole kinase [Patulibacter sp.]|uniref:hydroxyethylthiazole kinase n=1 Tax=Patulibacter sp. TaxID=1912859 RepID=UPI002727363A|nr:hydroxyethylthiazole kinase [Patulibacter sp.]MDO9410621.1 hydroxyethylthiazole kinase [Patulibacter sp.]
MSDPRTTRAWPHPEVVGDLASLRAAAPLTHCITNVVVSNVTANVLLAAGASPAMVHAPEEAGDLAAIAGGLLINLGTVTAEQGEAARVAVAAAVAHGVPWVLDPVAVGPLPMRTALAHELLERRPAVIRANASEVLALAGGTGGRGVDATSGPEAAVDAARGLAERTGAVVAISGPVDLLVTPGGVVEVPGGDGLLTRVTGAGCALGALVASFLAVAPDALRAATAAHAVIAVAAERASGAARGPGSFAVGLLDELSRLETPGR